LIENVVHLRQTVLAFTAGVVPQNEPRGARPLGWGRSFSRYGTTLINRSIKTNIYSIICHKQIIGT